MREDELANPAAAHAEVHCAELEKSPPPERWDDWIEYDSREWPHAIEKHYFVVPTTCQNCEAGCGMIAFVGKDDWTVRRMEGNPLHPASRGRLCAMGPATVSQIRDPERILHPLKRAGKRGEGKWRHIGWDEALGELSAEIRKLIVEDRRGEFVCHDGRAWEDGCAQRLLQACGFDGSCSDADASGAASRLGYGLWQGSDGVSPDYGHARFIFLISSPLDGERYFNPHAQRIIDAKLKGARIAVLDPRLSNTASMADYWLAPYPGTETAVLLAIARTLLEEGLWDRDFVRRWTNWRQYMAQEKGRPDSAFDDFVVCLRELYAACTPEFAEAESGIPAARVVEVAREIGGAGSAFAAHVWCGAAAGSLGGWQLARALEFLGVLTGSIGTKGGTSPAAWHRFVPAAFARPRPQGRSNHLLRPADFPLTHCDMGFLLPYFLKEGRVRLGVYITSFCNPVRTNPDGVSWTEVLGDEEKVGLHAALTPVWNETAWLADYVLPMGVGGEKHGLQSRETHAGLWIAFHQPVVRVAREKTGERFDYTYQANPGEVWEEDEFWISLAWRVDPDGALGIRRHFESPYREGERVTVEEYYRWIFENGVPGLPEAAAEKGLMPLEFMRKFGAFEITPEVYRRQSTPLRAERLENSRMDSLHRIIAADGSAVGTLVDSELVEGFPTPSRRLEFFSSTIKDRGWPEHSLPAYFPGHIQRQSVSRDRGEFILVPGFDLPTLTRAGSGDSKWLSELAHSNPVWIHSEDASRLGLSTGELVRVNTEIGYFITRLWVTEGIRPGVLAGLDQIGRWRFNEAEGADLWGSALVKLEDEGEGIWRLRQLAGARPFKSEDPDSSRIWWREAGVPQNLAFAPHPDPVSGGHCLNQLVRLERASAGDRYGDIRVDTKKSFEIYREWLALTHPVPRLRP